jgi:hypothetical protein
MRDNNDRIQLPEVVAQSDRTEAARLMAAIDAAQKALTDFAAPSMGTRFNLGPGETVDDWGGADEAPLVLVCPWCYEDVREGDIYDRELAERRSRPSSIDSDEKVVIISYDGHGHFDSVTLVHGQCGLPVSVPDGWELDSA